MQQGFVDAVPDAGVKLGGEGGAFADVADVLDHAQVDGAGGEGEGVAVVAEGVEEGVGGGIIGLACFADHAGEGGDGGEEGEGLGFWMRRVRG